MPRNQSLLIGWGMQKQSATLDSFIIIGVELNDLANVIAKACKTFR